MFWKFSKVVVQLLFAWRLLGGWLKSVTAPVDRDNLGVMKQAVEYRAGGGGDSEARLRRLLLGTGKIPFAVAPAKSRDPMVVFRVPRRIAT